ncbi:DUF4159 domain-containing protein [Pacificimonas flava]|uniref:Membrane protein, putative n=1 Tax=Pacificimonas flava TaxID=1234595 RepID=M2U968_9SPHN|nr:DUF4159 domain-containing protein [Pacificimonas flava]EMD84507.1 membrane protein, putative [Pacificimonas flava]MBB5279621.1 hypothetical protein [Pacificimonas flava]
MGGLTFAAPWLLAAAAVLPLIYILLRQAPPPALRAPLPSLKLLSREEIPPPQAARPPWWLLLFRLFIAALLIAALAGPSWQPQPPANLPQRLVIVIDNGWAAAPRWAEMVDAAERRVESLSGTGTRFAILPTAAQREERNGDGGPPRFVDGATARAALAALAPQPWGLDRAGAATRLPSEASYLWIADGYQTDGATDLRRRLEGGEILTFPSAAPVFTDLGPAAGGYAMRLARPGGGQEHAAVRVLTQNGREIVNGAAYFDGAGAALRLPVPAAEQNRAARIVAGDGPASTFLTAGASAPPRVAILDGESGDPPLQSGSFYIRRAIEPQAEIVRTDLAEAERSDAAMFILDDVPLSEAAAAPLLDRVENGAVAVSFAGPRTAENGTALSPVPLRSGARAFGGTLSWQEPQGIARFADGSPLAGLTGGNDIAIRRQLLTRDLPDGAMVWAALADGTPVVTAARRGAGLLILVHTSAAPDWSDLPLSGLFETIMRRFLPLAANPRALDIAARAPWRLERQMTGTAALMTPDVSAEIPADRWERAVASPETPPGLYRSGDLTQALNLTSTLRRDFRFRPLRTDGLSPAADMAPPIPLGRYLFLAACLLIAADMLLSLLLRGALRLGHSPGLRTSAQVTGAMAALLLAAPLMAQGPAPSPGPAAEEDAGMPRLQLAYIGGTGADAAVREGLEGLSQALARRTAVHPGEPARIAPDAANIGRYPVVYWPAYARGSMSVREAQNIRAYLDRGGLVLFDFGRPFDGTTNARRLLAPLGLPSLAEADRNHVLMKSYYLIGSAGGGALWVEAGTAGESGRVSSVAIGGGDWANLWSGATPAAPSVRENALRFGINLVMYALTGTYKADQVHTETLLGRIGRSAPE